MFWLRWVGLLAGLYAAAFVVAGVAVNATEQLTVATGITAVLMALLGGTLVLWRRRRVPPRAAKWSIMAVVSVTGGVLASGGGAVWYLEHPHLVTLSDEACEKVMQAHAETPSGGVAQCRFKAYLFRAQGGVGWYAVGVPENVEQECMFLSNDLVDPRTLETDLDGPRLVALPTKCEAEMKDLLARYPALQW